jgi:parvulin-like peptidyl-prolyl isomerase
LAKKDEELSKETQGSESKKAKPAPKAKPVTEKKYKPTLNIPPAKAPADKPEKADTSEPAAVSVKKAEPSDGSGTEGDAPKKRFPSLSKPSLAGLSSIGANRDIRSIVLRVALVALALIAIVVLVFGILIYVYRSESPTVAAVSQVVPYPVEQVNGRFVSYSDYLFEVDANKRAYQNNAKLNNQPAVDFNSADGKKLLKQIKQHSLDKLKSDALIAQLAAEKKVKVTDKEVDELVNQLYQRYGGKETLLKTLKDIYGWDMNDLKKVVRKQLLAKNLEEKVTADPAVDATAKAKAQDVLKQVKAGGDFAELAKKNSQASDASNGGDLGFFTKGQLPDNVQSAAEALQPGQVSDVVKTQYGYEIIKVLEKKEDGSIHAQHILIKTLDFNEYFQAELKKAKSKTFVKV